jgi:hypothetical protein
MARGTFANIRLKNLLVAPREGFWTRHFPDGAEMTIFDAAMQYLQEGTACVILAGKEKAGSSRTGRQGQARDPCSRASLLSASSLQPRGHGSPAGLSGWSMPITGLRGMRPSSVREDEYRSTLTVRPSLNGDKLDFAARC